MKQNTSAYLLQCIDQLDPSTSALSSLQTQEFNKMGRGWGGNTSRSPSSSLLGRMYFAPLLDFVQHTIPAASMPVFFFVLFVCVVQHQLLNFTHPAPTFEFHTPSMAWNTSTEVGRFAWPFFWLPPNMRVTLRLFVSCGALEEHCMHVKYVLFRTSWTHLSFPLLHDLH